MQIIILTNNPSAREVFSLACKTNAGLVMDFRSNDFSGPNGLTYSLRQHYCQLHHHFFPQSVIRRVKAWSHPNLPMIILVDKNQAINALRTTIMRDYPSTQFVTEVELCAA